MTGIVALLYVLFQRRRIEAPAEFLSKDTGIQFIFGLAILPLLLMFGSLFSAWCLEELVTTNRVLLCGAGFLSLFTLLEDKSR